MSSRKSNSDDDDVRLWESVTRSVKPIARRGIISSQRPETSALPKKTGGSSTKNRQTNIDDRREARGGGEASDTRSHTRNVADLSHGSAPGLDRRTAQRFRRGLMPIEATLDLHGHNRASGRQVLKSFLTNHQAAGRRCVLIITGRGLKDDWSVGVLRQAVPRWLNTEEFRKLVLAFAYARPNHGGRGALYILLRRNRQKAKPMSCTSVNPAGGSTAKSSTSEQP